LQALEGSSKLSRCFHTAEAAGSNPASPTPKGPANGGKEKLSIFVTEDFVQQRYGGLHISVKLASITGYHASQLTVQ
jgi:hypothetical protein